MDRELQHARKIIEKYYDKDADSYHVLISHSQAVRDKALQIAKKINGAHIDLELLSKGALLHDIGIYLTDAPEIGCFGKLPYVAHGYLGGEILRKEGFAREAFICERHVGSGISKKEIKEKNLPFPFRDMVPLTPEEEIVCLADKFFKKSEKDLCKERSIEEMKEEVGKHGQENLERLEKMLERYYF